MEYAALVDVYDELVETQSNLEKTAILAETFDNADKDSLGVVARFCQGRIFPSWDTRDLGMSSSLVKRAIKKDTGASEQTIDDTWRETGDLGDAAETLASSSSQGLGQFDPEYSHSLTVQDVMDQFEAIEQAEGDGSIDQKVTKLANLLAKSSPREAKYLVRLAIGAMRLGVGEGTVRDALAQTFLPEMDEDEAVALVEHAYDVTNDFGLVAETVATEGIEGLQDLEIELFRPIKVMLAQKIESMDEGFEELADDDGEVAIETKYDGMRTQIHKDGDDIRIFTRRLEEVTEQFPDIVAAVEESIDAETCIIEGEAVAYDPDDRSMVPFQELSKRIKRKYDIEEVKEQIPVVTYLFDIIMLDGTTMIDEPLRDRLAALESILEPREWQLERAAFLQTDDTEEADHFYQQALANDHEGVMLKNLDAGYKPGSRVGYMVKLKPIMETLDLVVTRAKWSEGRKSDWLGRLFVACRDPATDSFKEVGRMSTGYTDEQLAELTERLEPLITEEDGREVTLKPEVILEVAYEEIQESPKYDSGFALRFPRFIQVRDDLALDDVDSLTKVQNLFETQ
ncbi:MAG: ATP-dependent DNA ligase [Candidatus Nanohaloarchaeota archaeon QJJ-5]|nr:ATP-dependent DNA ligase [Candidatus Nanohaloarchaeota archaeon QJJ-5]